LTKWKLLAYASHLGPSGGGLFIGVGRIASIMVIYHSTMFCYLLERCNTAITDAISNENAEIWW